MEINPVSMKAYSSLNIGGKGKLVKISTLEVLKDTLVYAKKENRYVHIMGGGTNTYFGKNLSQFLFLKPELKGIRFEDKGEEVLVTAAQGEIWDELVQVCVKQNLWGIENLSYIPGTVGAAPVQNIGAYGVELKEVFISLQALVIENGQEVTLTKEDCKFGYRESIFKYNPGKYIIISITLRLQKNPNPILHYAPLQSFKNNTTIGIGEIRNLVVETRKNKLPDWITYPNAGSFFKNPVVEVSVVEYIKTLYPEIPTIEVVGGYKIPAAWLIEHVAEMKGVRKGDIGTWPHQPLAVVNYGNATADELDQFAQEIKEKINKKTGIVLTQEVNRVG